MNGNFKYLVTNDSTRNSYFRLDWALDAYRSWGTRFYIFTWVNFKPVYALLYWKGQSVEPPIKDEQKASNDIPEDSRDAFRATRPKRYTITLCEKDDYEIISKLEHTKHRQAYITDLIRRDIKQESA